MSKPNKNKPLTAHQLAEYLLNLPDFPILLAQNCDDLRDGYSSTITTEDIGIVRYIQTKDNNSVELLMEDGLHPKMNCKNVHIVLFSE